MRLVVLIAFLCAVPAFAADESRPARQRMSAQFRKEFRFDPEAAELERQRREQIDAADVVVLEPVHVRDKAGETARALEELMVRIEAEKFNWRTGGTIVKGKGGLLSPDLKFKYNPDHNGIDLINFSW